MANGLTPVLANDENVDASCPICYFTFSFDTIATSSEDVALNPVRTPCGHVFCSDCLVNWLASSHTCPMCRVSLINTADTGSYLNNVWLSLFDENVRPEYLRALQRHQNGAAPLTFPDSDFPALSNWIVGWSNEPLGETLEFDDALVMMTLQSLGLFEDLWSVEY